MRWVEIMSVRTSGKVQVMALMELCERLGPPAGRRVQLKLHRSVGKSHRPAMHRVQEGNGIRTASELL